MKDVLEDLQAMMDFWATIVEGPWRCCRGYYISIDDVTT